MKLYAARDKSGELYLYSEKPTKGENVWYCLACLNPLHLQALLPTVTWDDEEPREVNLILEIK